MKKRILSLLLALLLVVSIFPVSVLAENTNCNGDHDGWKKIDSFDNLKSLFQEGGSGYLNGDIKATEKLEVKKGVSLCLNGKVLNLDGNYIEIGNNAGFTLYDCGNSTHVFEVDMRGTGLWEQSSRPFGVYPIESLPSYPTSGFCVEAKGGVITGGKNNDSRNGGGAICISGNGASFTMNGGNIIGNTATIGGAVFIGKYSNGFTMNGGNIAGNVATNGGGGVYVNKSFTMNGGNIIGNTAGKGGGVFASGDNSNNIINLNGGTICYNSKDGIDLIKGEITFSGNVIVTGNGDSQNVKTNLHFISSNDIKYSIVKPGSEMSIGLTHDSDAFIFSSEDYTKYVFSDTPDAYVVFYDSSSKKIFLKEVLGVSTWSALQDAIDKAPGSKDEPATGTTNIKLTQDLTAPATGGASITIPAGKDITIDLNGKVLNAGGKFGVIKVEEGGKLTLIDSTPTTEHKGYVDANGLWHLGEKSPLGEKETAKTVKGGVITGGNDMNFGGVYVSNNGVLNMLGGSIVGNTATWNVAGGGVNCKAGSSFTMKDSNICGNVAAGGAGGVYGYGSEKDSFNFTMTNSSICGNTCPKGTGGVSLTENANFTMINSSIADNLGGEEDVGGVCVSESSFTMTGSSITGNMGNISGGVCVSDGSFTIINSRITDNTADMFGGGVLVFDGEVVLGGTTVIEENLVGETASNLVLFGSDPVTLGTKTASSDGNGVPVPADSMSVGVTMATPGTFTGTATETQKGYFSSDNSGYEVAFNTDHLELKKILGVSSWSDLQDAINAADGNAETQATATTTIKLTQNLTAPEQDGASITIPDGKDITLDLNGKVLNADGKFGVIKVETGGKLTVIDSDSTTEHYFNVDATTGLWTLTGAKTETTKTVKGGCITGGNDINFGGVFVAQGSPAGKLTMKGGNIVGNTSSNAGGGVYLQTGSTFDMEGGSIIGNITGTGKTGGGVGLTSASFTMTGGKIEYNVAANGGGVYSDKGTFTMTDGEINNNTATMFGGGVGVGNVSPSTFNMTGGKISDNTATNGGGVYNAGSFTMTGGEITNNKATTNGGGVYYNMGTITLGGTAKITDNTTGTNGTTNNLYLLNGKTVTLGTKTASSDGNSVAAPVTGESGMQIGVTTQTAPVEGTPVQITTNGAEAQKACFTPDNSGYEVAFKTDHLELKVPANANEIKMILVALSGGEQDSIPGVMEVTDDESTGFRTVKLLKIVDLGAENVTVAESVFLDLNHFNLSTTGTVTNNGTIILHQENAGVIDYLLYNVPGNYGTSEKLKLPTDQNPDYVIPASTFMTAEVGTNPAYQKLGFASGDDMLVWNKDVPAGMQLDVMYSLTLGGNILSAKTAGIKDTNVTAVNFALNKDISIGSNTATDGKATLTIKSLYDEDGDHAFDTIATFAANDKKITLNKTGKLVISSDAKGFDESVLVSGIQGMSVVKTEDKTAKTVTYSIAVPSPALAGKTDTTITMTAVAGLEYSIDDGKTWVFDGGADDGDSTNGTITFTNLTANKAYTIIARVKATGERSTASVITTKSTEQSTAAAEPVDVIGGEIKSGDTEVEVKDGNGGNIASQDLANVAEAINEVLDNDKVNNFGKATDETGIIEATKDNDSNIVAALKATTEDEIAKGNVTEANVSKYLNVELVSAGVNVEQVQEGTVTVTEMVFDVTPMATITVKGEGEASVTLTTKIDNNEIDGKVKFLLPVDNSIVAKTAAVYHKGDFLGNYEIKKDENNNKYIEVETDSFSKFGYITLDEKTAGARIGDTLYASLSDALTKVKNGETIELLKDSLGTLAVSRKISFTLNKNGKDATIIAGEGYVLTVNGNVYSIDEYKPEHRGNHGSSIVISGKKAKEQGEENPDTGAPAMNFGAIAVVLGAAYVLSKKH